MKKVFVIVNFLLTTFCCFSNEYTDRMVGTWIMKDGKGEIIESVSVHKVKEDVYYIIHLANKLIENDDFSFSNYGFVYKDEKIKTINENICDGEPFYILIFPKPDRANDILYFCWNHDELVYPYNEGDDPFYRVTYQTEEEKQKLKKFAEQEDMQKRLDAMKKSLKTRE